MYNILYLLINKISQRGDCMNVLTDERMNEIAEKAQKIRTEHGYNSWDFDLIKYLIEYEGFEIQLQLIDDDTTGLLFVDDKKIIPKTKSHKLIVVNQRLIDDEEFFQKRRFICAHEYGHYVLHKKDTSKFARRDTHDKESTEELEAEYFAYCFLMPENLMRELFSNEDGIKAIKEKLKMNNADIVSLLFKVSKKKAYNRLKDLGMLYYGESV